MKILLIAPEIYNYSNDISKSLQKAGHFVDSFTDYENSLTTRIIHHLSKTLLCIKQNTYIKKLTKSLTIPYDFIFIIRGFGYNKSSIELLRNTFPNAKLVLYQWDPINISLFDTKAFYLFNKCYSFDHKDVYYYKELEYKALFYNPDYNLHYSDNSDIDISFIGTDHSNRLKFLKDLHYTIKNRIKNIYIKVYCNKTRYYFQRMIKQSIYRNINMEWISFSPIPRNNAQDIFNRSNIIIDIHHPSQNGLSIRIIEVLSKGKKLITTNENIAMESFYDPRYICIVDRNNINIDDHFLLDKTKNNIDMNDYCLENWIKYILLNV